LAAGFEPQGLDPAELGYNPATDTWTQWDTGNVLLAAQPKIGGE